MASQSIQTLARPRSNTGRLTPSAPSDAGPLQAPQPTPCFYQPTLTFKDKFKTNQGLDHTLMCFIELIIRVLKPLILYSVQEKLVWMQGYPTNLLGTGPEMCTSSSGDKDMRPNGKDILFPIMLSPASQGTSSKSIQRLIRHAEAFLLVRQGSKLNKKRQGLTMRPALWPSVQTIITALNNSQTKDGFTVPSQLFPQSSHLPAQIVLYKTLVSKGDLLRLKRWAEVWALLERQRYQLDMKCQDVTEKILKAVVAY